MKYIDIHAHLNFAIYNEDRDSLIKKTIDNEISVINIGTQQSTSMEAVKIAEKVKSFYAIVGLHPIHTIESYHDEEEIGKEGEGFISRGEIFDKEYYRNLIISSNKVIGIGECGLDYYRNDKKTKEKQEKAFREQIELSIETDIPLMLHVRPSEGKYDAYYDVLSIIKEYIKKGFKLKGDVHFFAGTKEIAKEFIDLGFYISFTGVITFAKEYEDLVLFVPINRILSETDSPYVSPIPFRGKRNSPLNVREVVKKIAEIKKIDEDVVSKQIMKNAKRLFNIK